MRKPIYLIIGALFLAMGILVWTSVLFPGLPKVGYVRVMIGLVLVMMGGYRCAMAFYSGPPK